MQIVKRWERLAGLVVSSGLVISAGWMLMRSGIYGMALFVILPVILGALAACICKSATRGAAARTGALVVLVANLGLLVLGIEGLICIAMSIPLTVPLGALGGFLVQAAEHAKVPNKGTATLLLLLPFSGALGLDLTVKPEIFKVGTAIEIAVPPERVWKYVVSFPDLLPPDEWFFKAGIAYPERTRIVGSGVGATRYCDLSTGPVVEQVQIWDEPRLLQFRVIETPAPMRELSPYANLTPKHLHGYFTSKQGEFRLSELANGHTLLEGTSWYQDGIWPSQYWRLWSDAIVHRIHLRVLSHIQKLAERDYVTVH